MDTIRITRRNRFGFAWENTPVQTERGLTIRTPEAPDVRNLSFRKLREELAYYKRVNNSNDSSCSVFVCLAGVYRALIDWRNVTILYDPAVDAIAVEVI